MLSVADLELLRIVNLVLRHHNRAAYSSQVVRHVAEQIYELYWDSGEPDLDVEHDGPATLERGADLKDHKWVYPKHVEDGASSYNG
jgi:hypothetical protein